MRTGSPDELDRLSVPGSQAEGDAGVVAHVLHDTSKTFVVTRLDMPSVAVDLVGSSDATATIAYRLTGYDAAWPSLKPLGPTRTISRQKSLEFSLVSGAWLVTVAR